MNAVIPCSPGVEAEGAGAVLSRFGLVTIHPMLRFVFETSHRKSSTALWESCSSNKALAEGIFKSSSCTLPSSLLSTMGQRSHNSDHLPDTEKISDRCTLC
ncbi:hypothetical protein Anapl_16411 [Anas platyrhynchos]|uniref:Uncharacterized protein n=1 Tax=Anas platyrhynchos TaxID=8839 RepID=R0KY35_ANAPL|nr:hypothetical protein Anapl_16411 [Anas platyrhynchos]